MSLNGEQLAAFSCQCRACDSSDVRVEVGYGRGSQSTGMTWVYLVCQACGQREPLTDEKPEWAE